MLRTVTNTLSYSLFRWKALFITTLRTQRAGARQHQQHNLVRDSCMVPSDRQDQRETTKTRNEGGKYREKEIIS